MKLLLDEQLPRKLIKHFPPDVAVQTVQRQGWTGIKNGELLRLAALEGYDALISADKTWSTSRMLMNCLSQLFYMYSVCAPKTSRHSFLSRLKRWMLFRLQRSSVPSCKLKIFQGNVVF